MRIRPQAPHRPVVNRTLHTYHSTLRILCEAFQIEAEGHDVRWERRLVAEARRLNAANKMLAAIIDDAHLMDVTELRKIRLLFEDFPRTHCLILIAQPELLQNLTLTVNEDLKNRVTYSVLLKKLAPDSIADFIRVELDKAALAHSTFSDDALSLIVGSSEGGLRKARNLCLAALSKRSATAPKPSSSSRSTASCSSPLAQGGRPPALSRVTHSRLEWPTPS